MILDDLAARGLLHDTTDADALRELLDAGPVVLYHGIDPSAASLHIGNLVGVLAMRRFQDAGHVPLALVGGATGMIGDPSGRSDERNLLDAETLAANKAGIRSQLEGLLDFGGNSGARLVDNHDWTRDVTLLDFLRDVGKHVTVNQMTAKESVRSRLAGEHGISYTEFSYMLLQAFDYWVLHDQHGCRLQIGGSDQWGNITAGIDLVRRRCGAAVHGLTWPLVTRADGQKFGKSAAGKSADGAVWLDPQRSTPYEFHQYFLNSDDRDVERFLCQLTLLGLPEIAEVMASHRAAPEARLAQRRLADAVTELIHGPTETRRAGLAARVLFGAGSSGAGSSSGPDDAASAAAPGAETPDSEVLDAEALEALRGIVGETVLSPAAWAGAEPIVELLVVCGLCSSKGDARRTIAGGGVSANGRRVSDPAEAPALVDGRYLLLRRGKRHHHLVVAED